MFMTNGFVECERMGSWTFGDAYYRNLPRGTTRLHHSGLMPARMAPDVSEHAGELERCNSPHCWKRILTYMSSALPAVWQRDGSGPLRDSILDSDYFLTVARSLWAGAQVPSALRQPAIELASGYTLAGVQASDVRMVPMFGGNAHCRFFSVQASRALRCFGNACAIIFRTMMWCGRTDLRRGNLPSK
jgi:hypothetical protein